MEEKGLELTCRRTSQKRMVVERTRTLDARPLGQARWGREQGRRGAPAPGPPAEGERTGTRAAGGREHGHRQRKP